MRICCSRSSCNRICGCSCGRWIVVVVIVVGWSVVVVVVG